MLDRRLLAQAIENELRKVEGHRSHKGYVIVRCPFHDDRTPSARVRTDPNAKGMGRLWCWACRKSWKWNDFAPQLGLQEMDLKGFVTNKAQPLGSEIYDRLLLGVDENEPTKAEEPTRDGLFPIRPGRAQTLGLHDLSWRGFDLEWLSNDIRARFWYRRYPNSEKYDWWIWFPVLVNGKREGWIRGRLHKKEGAVSYFNKGGPWSKTHGLFPYDQAVALMHERNWISMVLVEGPRDALRLLRDGIPACAILGTSSWSKQKAHLLDLAGVENLILMMDGDRAGREATEFLEEQVRDQFNLRVIRLWKTAERLGKDKIDPCELPDSYVERLRKMVV